MARIVAALEAHNRIGAAGEPIDNLAFAFIAPLGADYCYISHGYTFTPARGSSDVPLD